MKLQAEDYIVCKRTSKHIGIEKGKQYKILRCQVVAGSLLLYPNKNLHWFSLHKLNKYFFANNKELRKYKLDKINESR